LQGLSIYTKQKSAVAVVSQRRDTWTQTDKHWNEERQTPYIGYEGNHIGEQKEVIIVAEGNTADKLCSTSREYEVMHTNGLISKYKDAIGWKRFEDSFYQNYYTFTKKFLGAEAVQAFTPADPQPSAPIFVDPEDWTNNPTNATPTTTTTTNATPTTTTTTNPAPKVIAHPSVVINDQSRGSSNDTTPIAVPQIIINVPVQNPGNKWDGSFKHMCDRARAKWCHKCNDTGVKPENGGYWHCECIRGIFRGFKYEHENQNCLYFLEKGKRAGFAYQNVVKEDPGYANWCRAHAYHPPFKHFMDWFDCKNALLLEYTDLS